MLKLDNLTDKTSDEKIEKLLSYKASSIQKMQLHYITGLNTRNISITAYEAGLLILAANNKRDITKRILQLTNNSN